MRDPNLTPRVRWNRVLASAARFHVAIPRLSETPPLSQRKVGLDRTLIMARNRKAKASAKTEEQTEPLLNIPEAEQLRIIKESGILNTVPLEGTPESEQEQLLSPLTEEIFSATALIIPHCFLLLMMEM